MKRSITTGLLALGTLFFVEFGVELVVQPNSTLAYLTGVISAQSGDETEKPEDPRPERKLPNVSQEWYMQIEKITAAVEEEEYDKAREMLDRHVQRTRRWNERELAIFHRRYLDLALTLEDHDLALVHAKKILEYAEFVTYFVEEQALWLIARIYGSDKYRDYETCLEYVQRWLDLKNDWDEGSNNYAFIAGIYTHMEDYYKTEEWITRAIDKAEEEGNVVQEQWWVQLWQAYIQLSEDLHDSPAERDSYLQKALDLSKFLVYEYIEKKEYWTRLSSVYAKIESLSDTIDEESTGKWGYAMEGAYHFGLLETESDLKRVISGIRSKEAHSRAAHVFEEGFNQEIIERNFDNLNRYAQTLYLTTDMERAAAAYEEAVSFKDDPTVLHSLASLHQLMDNYDKCISFAERALNATEGELRQPEQVKFLKGVCQFYDDDLDGSEATMEELREDIGTNSDNSRLESLRESAGQYIELIKGERSRIDWKNYVEEQWRLYNESKRS